MIPVKINTMGEIVTKVQRDVNCIAAEERIPPPRYHFNARYAENDEHCDSALYCPKRTPEGIVRCQVPRDKIKWDTHLPQYEPVNFTSKKILTKDGATYKDPDLIDVEFDKIEFNVVDKTYNCDRQSHHGTYSMQPVTIGDKKCLVPRNPVGRTGITGRGHLGRWGCNHAADPIVTTWSRDANGKVIIDKDSDKPILKFVVIQRRDTKEWAIPGGMRDPGEVVTKTLVREFAEEALDYQVKYDKNDKIDSNNGEIEQKLNKFFRNGTLIYKGYVDDPRNTDNAWMETIACNFHDEKGDLIGNISLKGGDDATHAIWMELNRNKKFYASHADFLEEVATIHGAHW